MFTCVSRSDYDLHPDISLDRQVIRSAWCGLEKERCPLVIKMKLVEYELARKRNLRGMSSFIEVVEYKPDTCKITNLKKNLFTEVECEIL
uniref:Uncharacterized protein n=1 Tax=Rhizophora mucronata TaxID=61149 RepID=A0A2P2LSU1_RHIMU